MEEYVYGVGEIEEMDDMLCLFVTKKDHWEKKGCMDDTFYPEIDDFLATLHITAEAENMYTHFPPVDDGRCLSSEELRTIAHKIGLVHDHKFEDYVAPKRDEDDDY